MYATSIGMSQDGKSVAVGYPDGSVEFYEPKSGKCLHAVPPLGQFSARCVTYHPKGEYVACVAHSRGGANLHILSAASGKTITSISADAKEILSLCFDSGGDHLAVFTSSGTIKIYDARPLLKLQKE
jgi:WD40 repeat protein